MHCSVIRATAALMSLSWLVLWAPTAGANARKIEHVVIIIQENRTPDNLFHFLKQYLPSADIVDSGLNSKGETIKLTPYPLAGGYDLSHSHPAFLDMYDGGRMDGADLIPCLAEGSKCPPNAAFRYVPYTDVAPYYWMATHYGFANRMFQTNQGPSFPAHQFLFAGTSQPYPNVPRFAAGNMFLDNDAGCAAASNQRVELVDKRGEHASMFPCFEHQTLADLLEQPRNNPTHPFSWRYYGSGPGSIWMAPNSIDHLCEAAGEPRKCTSKEWTTGGNVIDWPPQILLDIQQGDLPAVTWVTPTGQDSDHAGSNYGSGPSWVASIINQIGHSAYWKNTVIFVTWDDWGGWYDHVKPPIDPSYGYYEYGFRVPLLVVSPYTRAGYVSEKTHDFGSILRYVEETFDLGLIPPGNFADARADNLMDFFDFSKTPRSFVSIPTKVPTAKFLDRKRPMMAPDNDGDSD
jgi:phospholipase C